MNDFLEFLQKPWIQLVGWTLGAVGWIVGIFSGFLEWRGYRQQKRFEKGYENILEQAKRDWEGKYTEEQIQDLSNELSRLQEKIQSDVPREARRVFLEDQRTTILDNLEELYSHYIQVLKELESSKQTREHSLPKEIKSAIEAIVIPSYIAKQRKQRSIYWLLVLVLLVSIIVNLNFFIFIFRVKVKIVYYTYPLSWVLLFGFVIFTIAYILSRVTKGKIESWLNSKSILSKIFIAVSWVISMVSFYVLLELSSEWPQRYYSFENLMIRISITIAFATPIAFSILSSFYSLSSLFLKYNQIVRLKR